LERLKTVTNEFPVIEKLRTELARPDEIDDVSAESREPKHKVAILVSEFACLKKCGAEQATNAAEEANTTEAVGVEVKRGLDSFRLDVRSLKSEFKKPISEKSECRLVAERGF
jgi:hypothetical protein